MRPYLPILLDMSARRVLVVGGGRVGYQKLKALSAFGLDLTIVSPAFDPRIAGFPRVRQLPRAFEEADLELAEVVVICTDDHDLNDRIAALARQRGLLVNNASHPAEGDFISPASLKEGPFILSVSSSGTGVKKSVRIRDVLAPHFLKAVADSQED